MSVAPPEVGDFTAWVVSAPGPDVDYALCIDLREGKALLRFQVWQQDGPWHEKWVSVTGNSKYGCWKTERIDEIGPNLKSERKRFLAEIISK